MSDIAAPKMPARLCSFMFVYVRLCSDNGLLRALRVFRIARSRTGSGCGCAWMARGVQAHAGGWCGVVVVWGEGRATRREILDGRVQGGAGGAGSMSAGRGGGEMGWRPRRLPWPAGRGASPPFFV